MTTYTHTYTNTFTEARAREVMHHVLGDFVIVANRGMIALSTIQAWHEEIFPRRDVTGCSWRNRSVALGRAAREKA